MIKVRHVTHAFGDLPALSDVSLTIHAGRILGLLGENGAGKTTLMKVLFGAVHPDSGDMEIDGRPYSPSGPRDALSRGIGMVHQHFMLVPTLTIAENIVLGMTRRQAPPRRKLFGAVDEFARDVDLPVDSRTLVSGLSVGTRQRVEILKALFRRVRTLILDEPTAVLTPAEADQLFAGMRRLRERGVGIIFISHKLREILGHCDDVAVLRHGRLVFESPAADVSPDKLAEEMIGRRLPTTRAARSQSAPLTDPAAPPVVLKLAQLSLPRRPPASDFLHRADLTVRAGEIVGIAGVDGNGQESLFTALAGLRRASQGRINLNGIDMRDARPHDWIHAGVAHIPNDRQRDGLILDFSLAENGAIKHHDSTPFSRFGFLSRRAMRSAASAVMRQFDVRAPSVDAPARALSGGNQQKFIVGRELSGEPSLIVAYNPTRGVDLGATAYIREQLRAAADNGAAVLLISADLDEIAELADRIGVLYGGALAMSGWPQCGIDQIGRMMAGVAAPTSTTGAEPDSIDNSPRA